MDKRIVYLITFVVCILLELAIAPLIAIGGCSPSFLLIPVLLVSMHSGPAVGSITGFLLGLLADFNSDTAIGCTALIFILIAVIVGFISSNLEAKTPLLTCILVVCSSFFFEIAYGFAIVLTNIQATGVISTMVGHALPSAVYTMVLGCIGLVTMNLVTADDGPQASYLGGQRGRSGGYSMPTRFK